MAHRTQIIAELASNHGGQWDLCADMIRSAADHGADWVKLQLYDAAVLDDRDPQKAWLTQAQVTRPVLDRMIGVAAKANVQLTASVFGIPQAIEAHAAGLTTIKLGSGEIGRIDLFETCIHLFGNTGNVWTSHGLTSWDDDELRVLGMRTPFHGISQYPTPYLRGLAALYRVGATFGAWGWSDHGDTLEVAKEAILHGATYVERHYTLGVGRGCRHDAWDTSYDQLKELRTFAESCAWESTAEYTAACKTYLGRWGA